MKELDEDEVEVVVEEVKIELDRKDEELVVVDLEKMPWKVKTPIIAPMITIPSIAIAMTFLESDLLDIVWNLSNPVTTFQWNRQMVI